jgi:hypothetical protein
MEYQHQTEQQGPVVLQYTKRRYDGGTEIELIKYIEAKKSLKAIEDKVLAEMDLEQTMDHDDEPMPMADVSAPEAVTEAHRKTKILEALLLGPMELAVGMVGMLTTVLAIAAFRYQKKQPLVEQSKAVFKECWTTFLQGSIHVWTGPFRALKVALSR